MKPAYWIGIMALVGALLGYAISKWTGWYGAGAGVVVGILVGAIISSRLQGKA